VSDLIPVEERALAATREWVRHLSTRFDLIAEDVSPWSQHDNRRLVIELMKNLAISRPGAMLYVIDRARAGWDIADEALRQLIIDYIERGQPMPISFAAYTETLVHSPRRELRGKKKSDYVLRDLAISSLVWNLCDTFNLKPTGRSTRRRSACSIVAQALGEEAHINMSAKRVEAIWLVYAPAIVQ